MRALAMPLEPGHSVVSPANSFASAASTATFTFAAPLAAQPATPIANEHMQLLSPHHLPHPHQHPRLSAPLSSTSSSASSSLQQWPAFTPTADDEEYEDARRAAAVKAACSIGSDLVVSDEEDDEDVHSSRFLGGLREQRKRRRLGFSVFVDPNDHPDNHVLRHLNISCSGSTVPVREKTRRMHHLLRRHPLFRALSPEIARRALTEFIREVKSASSVLFHAGDINDTFYIVDEGEVTCEYVEDGLRTVVRKCAGDTIGDLALMQPFTARQVFTARITSVTGASLYSIEGCIFRFLVQNGMQLRYAQLKTFFQGLPMFRAHDDATHLDAHCQAEIIDSLIEHAQILEFREGDVIVPAQAPTQTESIDIPSIASATASACHSSSHTRSSSITRSFARPLPLLPSSSSFTSFADSESSSLPGETPTEEAPAYLSNSIFLVQDGRVGIRRALSPESQLAAGGDELVQIVGDGELFGLEILSCQHKLMDFAVPPTSASPAPSVAHSQPPSRGEPQRHASPMRRPRGFFPFGLGPGSISGSTTTGSSPVSRTKSLRGKRGRSDSDDSDDEARPDSPAPGLLMFAPPLLPSSPSPSPAQGLQSPSTPALPERAAAVRACTCRGEVRCHSAAAIVIAVDAKTWKNALLKAI